MAEYASPRFATPEEVRARARLPPAPPPSAPSAQFAAEERRLAEPVSDAESAAMAQRGGALGAYDRSGQVIGFRDTTTGDVALHPPARAPGMDPQAYDAARTAEDRAMGAVRLPGAAGTAGTAGTAGRAEGGVAPVATPDAQPQVVFTDYKSTNPTSMYDRDIKLTHNISRMMGLVGLGGDAANARDAYYKLTGARQQEVGNNAIKAFLAGDVTKGIDMFNHMVPNGRKIAGYTMSPDKQSYLFRMEDGTTETRTKAQFEDSLIAFKDPAVLGEMLKARGKAQAEGVARTATARVEAAGRMSLEGLKFEHDLAKLIGKEQMDHASKVAIEELKRRNPDVKIAFDVVQGTFAQTPDGVFKWGDVKTATGTRKDWVRQDIPGSAPSARPAPGATGAAAPPTSGGYRIDAGRMGALQIPPVYGAPQ